MKLIRQFVVVCYLAVDILLLGASFCIPYFLYYKTLPHDFKTHWLIYAFWLVVTVLLFFTSQLYLTPRELTIWREAKRVVRAFILATLSTSLLLFALKVQTFSRLVMVSNFSFGLLSVVAWRIVKRFFVGHLVARGFNNNHILIVGAGQAGRKLAEKLDMHPELGFRIAGFLDDQISVGTDVSKHLVVGETKDFDNCVRRYFIDQVFITIPSQRKLVGEITLNAKLMGVAVQVIPDRFDLEFNDLRLHMIGGIPVLEYHSVSPNYKMIVVKRTMDFASSLFGLIVLFPFFLVLAVAIKLDSKGPVFYASKRWGKKGKLFNCYKFRSMVHNAHELRAELLQSNELSGAAFKIKNDPRVTQVGRLLRKYSIDELPQLWNVLTGDMSLVGPRPLPEEERVDEYKLEYLNRLSIKPGLTCLWQIRGRSDIPFSRWMKLDDYYIRNWSPQMDIEILMRTIPAVFKGKGAY